MPEQSQILTDLGVLFDGTLPDNRSMTLQRARDTLRNRLAVSHPDLGPRGSKPTDIYLLLENIIKIDIPILQQYYKCRACDYDGPANSKPEAVWICDDYVWKNSPAMSGRYQEKTVTQ